MATPEHLNAIAVDPAGGIWAAGDQGVLVHSKSNGARWSHPEPPVKTNFRAIAVSGSRIFFAGDGGTILRLEGSTFHVESLDTKADIKALWSPGENDVWAIGQYGLEDRGVVLHFDGTKWSHVADEGLPAMDAIHGSGPNDVWMANHRDVISSYIDFYHLENGAWRVASEYNSISGYELRDMWVSAPNDIVVTSCFGGYCSIFRYDGSGLEREYVIDATLNDLTRFARAPDGALWVAADPPLVRDASRQWKVAPGIRPLPYRDVDVVRSLTFMNGEPWVAGTCGLLGNPKDTTFRNHPNEGVRSGKAFSNGVILQTPERVLRRDVDGTFHVLRDEDEREALLFVGANSMNDIAVLARRAGNPQQLVVERYDGTSFREVRVSNIVNRTFTPLMLAPNGDLYWTERTVDPSTSEVTSAEMGKLARDSSTWTPVRCNGKPLNGEHLWTDGRDILVDSGRAPGAEVGNWRLGSDGSCTLMPASASLHWHSLVGKTYSDLWNLELGKQPALSHFDGTTWTARARPDGYDMLHQLDDGSIWLTLDDLRQVGRWNGSGVDTFSLPTAVGTSSTLYGTDAAHLWNADTCGRIFRYRP